MGLPQHRSYSSAMEQPWDWNRHEEPPSLGHAAAAIGEQQKHVHFHTKLERETAAWWYACVLSAAKLKKKLHAQYRSHGISVLH